MTLIKIILAINIIFLLLFLLWNFLQQFLWPVWLLLWAMSVTNTPTAMYIWHSAYFEEGSHVVLGTTYRKAKIVGSYGVGKNYIMMRLEEVGRVPEDWIVIRRIVVFTCPFPLSFQMSFHQHLLQFFLNHFLGTFRDIADNDDHSFEKDIKSSSDQLSDSFNSNSELFDQVEFPSEDMWELVSWVFHEWGTSLMFSIIWTSL